MSERGKNWNLPEQIASLENERHPDSSGPVSIRVDSKPSDSDRPTMPAPESIRKGQTQSKPRLIAPLPVPEAGTRQEKTTEEPVVQDNSVEETRQSSRYKLLSIAWLSGVLGVGAGTFYMHETQQGPFAPEEKATVIQQTPPEKTQPEEPGPIIIKSNEELEKALKKQNIKATPEDFEFEGASSIHAKTLRLIAIAGNERLGVKSSFTWEPVTEKIATVEEPHALIAVQFLNQYALRDLEKHVNPGPGAHRYIARTQDEENPNIIYFYFDKCLNTERTNMLARVRIQSPQDHSKHVWYNSFNLAPCQDKTDSVESDEPVQE